MISLSLLFMGIFKLNTIKKLVDIFGILDEIAMPLYTIMAASIFKSLGFV